MAEKSTGIGGGSEAKKGETNLTPDWVIETTVPAARGV